MEVKRSDYPRTALDYYVKLYCKNKAKSTSKDHAVVEAMRSWLALNEEQKEKVTNSFEESLKKYKLRMANYLKSAEPYLKEKITSHKERQKEPKDKVINLDSSCEQSDVEEDANGTSTSVMLCDSRMEISPQEEIDAELSNDYDQQHFEEQAITRLTEPEPPTIITAKQLYETINPSKCTEQPYNTLTDVEKRHYQTALRVLKNQYITKYKEYLESLPSEELFKHYCEKIRDDTYRMRT